MKFGLNVMSSGAMETLHNGQRKGAQEPSVVRGPRKPGVLEITFSEIVERSCLESPNDIAIISQHQNICLSYALMKEGSDMVAAGLQALGVGRGDRVAVLLGNRAEYFQVRFRH
jgi:mevalonyl-CoA ligase